MVTARRSFQGTLPLAAMTRLRELLAADEGVAAYELDFGRDDLGVAFLDVRVEAPLSLICQRSLEPFVLPLRVATRLGLIRAESEEAGLSPETEPLLVDASGQLVMSDVIEDELLLAVPLVPVNPDSELSEDVTGSGAAEAATGETENPFAILRELKK